MSTIGPPNVSPDQVCGVSGNASPNVDLVSLAGHEFPRSMLDRPDAQDQDLDTPTARALRASLDTPVEQNAPRTGWRLVVDQQDLAVFAAPDGAGTWSTVTVQENDGRWSWAGSSAGQQPGLTTEQRGAGLRLEWSGTVAVPEGEAPQGLLQLVNDRQTTWVDDRGEYWGIAHVFDRETGAPVSGDVGIAGVGRTYRLDPGATVALPVAWPPGVRTLSPGTYDVVACVPELALASSVGTLRIDPTG